MLFYDVGLAVAQGFIEQLVGDVAEQPGEVATLGQLEGLLALKVEFVVAVAGHVDVESVHGVDHLPAVLDVGEGGRREAVARKEGECMRILLAQCLNLSLEVADAPRAVLGLDIVDIVEVEDGEDGLTVVGVGRGLVELPLHIGVCT